MKKLTITIIAVVGMMLAVSFAHADGNQSASYYHDCINRKIVDCERVASNTNYNCSCMFRLVKTRSAQAAFYRKHQEELVKEMVALDIAARPHAGDHFLITSFYSSL